MSSKEDEWAEFREVAESYGLEAHLAALEKLCVPSLRLRADPKSKKRSRIGGRAEVPAGFTWPMTSENEPLEFIAQLDCEDLQKTKMPGVERLPKKGLLSFFFGLEPTGNAGRVFFFEGPVREIESKANAYPRMPVRFEVETEQLPPLESPFYAPLATDDRFEQMIEEYGQLGVRDDDERPVHRVLGYADPLQADVYAATEGNQKRVPVDRWTSVEHLRDAAKWNLLLQLDSDQANDFLIGDLGVLAFLIRSDDLAARRFENAWAEMQSH